jgi:cardiolipin synthase A/B
MPGSRLRAARPRAPPRPVGLNFRNHRKIVVVDGMRAFTGGMNVGDEYLASGATRRVEVRGPLVAQLQAQFLQDWFWVSGQRLDDDLLWICRADPEDMTGLVVGASPTDPHDNGALYFVALAQTAQKRLWIASPYFAPEQSVLAALKLAALRGVEVRILLPEVPDRWTPWIAAFAFFDEVRHARAARSGAIRAASCTRRSCWWTTTSCRSGRSTSTSAPAC